MHNSIFRKKKIYFWLCPGLLIIIAFWFNGRGMTGPFNKVNEFSRNISLLSTVDRGQVIFSSLGQEENIVSRCLYPKVNKSISQSLIFAIKPNNENFYICTDKIIAEYDGAGNFIRNMEVPEFDISPYVFAHLGNAYASNDRLWLSLAFWTDNDCKDIVIGYEINNEKSKPEILQIDPNIPVDPFGRVQLMFKNEGGIYALDAKEIIGSSWAEVDRADVMNSASLISDDVSLMDISKNTKSNIAEGTCAKWASDGYIYFVHKGTELRRVKPGEKPETIYKATVIARGGEKSTGNELVFDASRTCLAFCYRVPIHSKYDSFRCGVVIIDLKTNEYMEISANSFYDIYRNMVSEGLLDLKSETMEVLYIKKHFWSREDKHFWHIESMALMVREGN